MDGLMDGRPVVVWSFLAVRLSVTVALESVCCCSLVLNCSPSVCRAMSQLAMHRRFRCIYIHCTIFRFALSLSPSSAITKLRCSPGVVVDQDGLPACLPGGGHKHQEQTHAHEPPLIV